MRLSTLQIFQQGIDNILAKQAEVQSTQTQLATGKRVNSPSDDPIAAVQILDLSEDIAAVDQYQRNASLAEGQLAVEENTIAAAALVLQRVRELTVQANNATQNAETRGAIAAELDARLDELVALANTRDGSGEYIFAGFQAGSEPFSRSGGEVVYNGDDGQRFLQISNNAQVAVRDSGADVFVDVPIGNGRFTVTADPANTGTAAVGSSAADSTYQRETYTIAFTQATPGDPVTYTVTGSVSGIVDAGNYTSGETLAFNGAAVTFGGEPADGDSFTIPSTAKQDVFTTIDQLVSALRDNGDSPADRTAVNSALSAGLDNLDQALGNMIDKQAEIGSRLNRVQSQIDINDNFSLQLQETLSDVQDLDYAEAISKLNLQLVALEAAQQTYVRAQGLSLFNFLR